MKRLFALFLLALPLVSCSSDPELPTPLPLNDCPQIAVIRDLSVYQHPPVADEKNLVITARMGNISAGCSLGSDGQIIEGGFNVVAMRGNNTAGKRAAIPFFVSVVDANDTVLKKETYEIPIVFDGNEREVKMNVPVNPKLGVPDGMDPRQARVLVGFQLSADQLNANTNFFSSTASPTPQQ